jgi:ribonuclease P protein component
MPGACQPDAAAHPLRFPRERRLRSATDFKRVYAQGRRFGNELFTVNAHPNGLERPRLGMSVAVRTMGGGVPRNRVRRMIRESFRLNQSRLPPLDIVVGVRAGARTASPDALREALERLWTRLCRAPAPSS